MIFSRACTPCSTRLVDSTWLRRSVRSSSMVSNSLASWAKSSSAAGMTRSLTALTTTVTSASAPACSPPRSGEVKIASSSADRPTTASSVPSSMVPDPIS